MYLPQHLAHQHGAHVLVTIGELDDAPGFERFFLITSGFPLDVNTIMKKAESLARDPERVREKKLDLSEDLRQYSVLILKGEGS